ncbi:MAG TPA: AAA family ATPase [Dehalococcoidia bacterium]|nr:AAA family ATPase [Dehalococcoidia bacterium]
MNALVVLCGPSGSGKSTFAAKQFAPEQIISSDRLRGLVSGDEADQTASGAAFTLLRRTVRDRIQRGQLTVVDTTAARARDRRALVNLARPYAVPVVAIVFSASLETCLYRNRSRRRQVPAGVIARQHALMHQSMARIAMEGFQAVYVLRDACAGVVEHDGP